MVGRSKTGNGRRMPFSVAAQKRFLTHLAETSNVRESARMAGVSTATVYERRRRSDAFRAQWHKALSEGFARIEALLLEDALKAPSAKTSPAMQRARDAKNRLRSQLLAHHRAAVRGEGNITAEAKSDKDASLKTEIARRINQMRKNIRDREQSDGG